MAKPTSTNPHIRDHYSPLEELIVKVLRRYGEFHPSAVDGEVGLMMIDFANSVILDYNTHPYREGDTPIKDYISLQEAREIPDEIITSGVIYLYAVQQLSEKMQPYRSMYYDTLNTITYYNKFGNAPIITKKYE
jgi:hypothetical protein